MKAMVIAPKTIKQMAGSIAINKRPYNPLRTTRRSVRVQGRRTRVWSQLRTVERGISVGSARASALLGCLLAFVLVSGPAVAHEASFRGLVLALEPQRGEVIVRHDALLGHAAAVTTFRVAPASALRSLRVGETIDATASSDSEPWTLSGIHMLGSQALTGSLASGGSTTVPSVVRNVHHVTVGESAPLSTLVDQRGRQFTLRDFRGSAVVMAFAYTRCRDPRECRLITARFHTLQAKFRSSPVHLVEVTLDPAYDRPAVLAQYGRAFGNDPQRWTLATGDPETVLDFAAQFDVTAFPDERVGLIHPERVVILDKFGDVREMIDEGAWSPNEIVAAVQHDQRLASNPLDRLNLWLSSAAVSVCGNAVAGFSGFTDLLTVVTIAAFFGFLLWRVGRGIARGTT